MTYYERADLKKPIYCDDVYFDLLTGRKDIQPENILNNQQDIDSVEISLQIVKDYINFLEEDIIST